jgi:hypothetical protein
MSSEPIKPPYIDDDGPNEPSIPEKKLLVAIIQRALIDYSSHTRSTPYLQYTAAAWLFSSSRELMSLHWICGYLSEDPQGLQEAIQKSARTNQPKRNTVVIRVETTRKAK